MVIPSCATPSRDWLDSGSERCHRYGAVAKVTEDGAEVRVPIPGAGPNDVVVELVGGQLQIRVSQGLSGSGEDVFKLRPVRNTFDLAKTTASVDKGILTLTIPRIQAVTIEVTTPAGQEELGLKAAPATTSESPEQ